MAFDEAMSEVLVRFKFKRRQTDLPPDLRPEWRVATVVLLLSNCCKGGKASLMRLHVLGWAILSAEAQSDLLAYAEGGVRTESVVVRYDPALNRAIDFAASEGLVQQAGNRVVLQEKGKTMAAEILATEGLMNSEKVFIAKLGRRLTEDGVKRLAERGDSDGSLH